MFAPDGLRPAPPDVTAIVERLIAATFPQLAEARLVVAVRDKAEDVGDGKVRVAATGVNSDDPSLPFDYLVTFAMDAWAVISDGDREAMVYHELLHCSRDEQGKPKLREHDAGVFNEEVEKYGVWWKDAQQRFKQSRDAGER